MPDLKWIDDVMPDNEKWNEWRASLIQLRDGVKDNIQIGSNFILLSVCMVFSKE